MPKKDRNSEYYIFDKESVNDAARILKAASPERGIILVLGNRIDPVDIPDFVGFRNRIQSETTQVIDRSQTQRRYFEYTERIRLITNNYLPHRNLVCIMRLVRKGIVKAIITTNYDYKISSTFQRYGQAYQCVRNPCMSKKDIQSCIWDRDGYYSRDTIRQNCIPLWKIHGDIGFVRIDGCNHIFALPKFIIRDAELSSWDQFICCHYAICKHSGTQYRDPSLLTEHIATGYRHHIDYGTDRHLFISESKAAQQALLEHAKQGGDVFVIGLSFQPIFLEELTPTLVEVAMRKRLVYIMSSKDVLKPSDSDLYYDLQRKSIDFALVNEINSEGALHESLKLILGKVGERGIDREYESWIKGGKWWLPKR